MIEDVQTPLFSAVEATTDIRDRPIKSYVLRQGRMTAAQRRYYDDGMPRWSIPYQPEVIDLQQVFGRMAPTILEIGFGMGETTAQIAAAHPDQDYLGLEVHQPGVGSLLRLIAEQNLTNIRIIQHDAVAVLTQMLPADRLDGVHIYFPDPWPKARHHKRRLIQPPLVRLLASRVRPGGYLHLATDWQNYAEQMLEVLTAEPLLRNRHSDYAPRPDSRPLTKFERRGERLGHGVWDVLFERG